MNRVHPRGHVLLVVFILLVVLAAVGSATVLLSSRGRIAAGAQAGYDSLVECANAAQAQLWAQVGVQGHQYYRQPSSTMTVLSIALRDGTELMAPAHLDGTPASTVAQGIRSGVPAGTADGLSQDQDGTNKLFGGNGRSGLGGGGTMATARCKDAVGRVHEVEFSFRFAL